MFMKVVWGYFVLSTSVAQNFTVGTHDFIKLLFLM